MFFGQLVNNRPLWHICLLVEVGPRCDSERSWRIKVDPLVFDFGQHAGIGRRLWFKSFSSSLNPKCWYRLLPFLPFLALLTNDAFLSEVVDFKVLCRALGEWVCNKLLGGIDRHWREKQGVIRCKHMLVVVSKSSRLAA